MRKVKRGKKGFLGNPETIKQGNEIRFRDLDNLIRGNKNGLQKKFEFIKKNATFYSHNSIILIEGTTFWIYTLPESRKKGSATKLMTEYIVFITLLKEKYVGVSIKKDNIGSIRMFEKIGFKRNMKKTFRKISRGLHSENEIIFELDVTREKLDKLPITQEILNESSIIYKEYDECFLK